MELLVDKNGVEKSSQEDLESISVDFYTSLFSKDVIDMQVQTELIDDLEFSLTDSEREQCEDRFTKAELLSVLQGLQTGKSANRQGLTDSLLSFILPFGIPFAIFFSRFLMSAFVLASFRIVSARAFYA